MSMAANLRSALDARMVQCFHIDGHWSGASRSDLSAPAARFGRTLPAGIVHLAANYGVKQI
jgi:hypothetical protein